MSSGLFWPKAAETSDYQPLPLHQETTHSSNKNLALNGSAKRSRYFHALVALLQLCLIAFACYGVVTLVELKLGRIIRAQRISPEALRQAGWARRPLLPGDRDSGALVLESRPPQLVLHEFATEQSPAISTNDLHLLILTPLRNAQSSLPHLFNILQSLDHPKVNTSLGFLIGDEDDESAKLLYDFVIAQAKHYRRISLLRKDFRMDIPSGAERHSAFKQDQRRSIMARARTFLVTATLEPSVDWVLWLDSDVFDVPTSLFADLLTLGNAGVQGHISTGPLNDVITPNIMTMPSAGHLHGYDLNNWAETDESLSLKANLAEEDIMVEGNILHPTYRKHLVDFYLPSNHSLHPHFLPSQNPSTREAIDRFDPTSPAYIGRTIPLDAVGGVATLVRATAHRMGAIFPAWPMDHQLETEGFGVMARKIGARIVGLPNFVVLHALQE